MDFSLNNNRIHGFYVSILQKKPQILIIVFSIFSFLSSNVIANEDNHYVTEFRKATFQSCDKVFHEIENKCENMICRDILVNAWAECWRRSMNSALDKRLLKLKKIDTVEFHFEMDLQKTFNEATYNLCGKSCDDNGNMKGIPYNFCRVDAYKYRSAQAIQINKNQLTIPLSENIQPKKARKEKDKDTNFYKTFSEKICKMPKTVWGGGNRPVDCEKKMFNDLNSFEFTDDVCDLS